MNNIKQIFSTPKNLLSIYFTAGYPKLNDTVEIIQRLEKSGVDIVEIGLPFSDPLADGPTIQQSSTIALQNGMTTKILFEQLKHVRESVSIPLLIMGYFNPILQFGVEEFCKNCAEVGIDGLIIPDLPVEIYNNDYKAIFEKYGIVNVFLITPQTSESRVRNIDNESDGFIYTVSSASVTGTNNGFGDEQKKYFERVEKMNLKNPQLIGFGISDNESYQQATQFARGGIIGSAFIKFIAEKGIGGIEEFTKQFRR